MSERFYKADIFGVDYEKGAEAKKLINDWVSNKTEGLIPSMLSDAPNAETQAIIASALYFEDEWTTHFMPEEFTRRMPFYVEENESHEIDMMVNMNKFNYHLDEDFGAQIIELPYEGSKLSMYVLLPTKVGSSHLRELKKKLTFERIEDLIGKMKDTHCSLGLPRMRLSSELELRDVLGAMGLETLFDPAAADLSYGEPRNNNNNNSHEENATTSHRAYLDEIVQKVEMSVTESGTKAAAADIGIIDRAGGIYKRFLADHPFLFFIRHKVTKSILFYGTINKP
ncbi:hypothetical protein TKK_0014994 [Trichogramma kaykai]